jgi:hypothetical protein
MVLVMGEKAFSFNRLRMEITLGRDGGHRD